MRFALCFIKRTCFRMKVLDNPKTLKAAAIYKLERLTVFL